VATELAKRHGSDLHMQQHVCLLMSYIAY